MVADSPGLNDSEGRDEQIWDQIVKLLNSKRCDAFFIVINSQAIKFT